MKRTPLKPFALPAALLVASLAAPAALMPASAAAVVVEHQSGALPAVDVYANGRLLYGNLHAGANSASDARVLTVQAVNSTVAFVVTPVGIAPGVRDLVRKTVSFVGSDRTMRLSFGLDRKGEAQLNFEPFRAGPIRLAP